MRIQIVEVKTPRELNAFIDFPLSLYRDNPYYVPSMRLDELNTLRKEKNPAFETCEARYWLARDGKRIVGRVAAILNKPHIEKWGQRYLRFSWLDFIDDEEVSRALMSTVEDWARELSLSAVHGPLGFTDLDREGMLVEGFDEVSTMATFYNHPYYPKHLEKLGYSKDTDWVEYEMQVPPVPNETIARIADIAMRRNHLRMLDIKRKKDILLHARELFALLEDEYTHLYGAVPLTARQVDTYVQQYFGFVDIDFVPMVMDQNDRMVAFGIVIPSLTKALQRSGGRLFPFGFIHLLRALKSNDRADLLLVAVRSEYQGKGVNAIIMDHMHRVFIRRGITRIESNPELETNQNVQGQWKYYDRRQHKRRRIYIKHFPPQGDPA